MSVKTEIEKTKLQYKWLTRPLIHPNAIASLDWRGKSVPVPLHHSLFQGWKQKSRYKFYIYWDGSHAQTQRSQATWSDFANTISWVHRQGSRIKKSLLRNVKHSIWLSHNITYLVFWVHPSCCSWPSMTRCDVAGVFTVKLRSESKGKQENGEWQELQSCEMATQSYHLYPEFLPFGGFSKFHTLRPWARGIQIPVFMFHQDNLHTGWK